eukprot:403361402
MLRQELFPYLDIENVKKMLHINKAANILIADHFTMNFQYFRLLLSFHWKIPIETLNQFQSLEELQDSQQLMRLKDCPFTYVRFNQTTRRFEYLAYAGGDFPTRGTIPYRYKKCPPQGTFGQDLVYIYCVREIPCWVKTQRVRPGIYQVSILHAISYKSNFIEAADLIIDIIFPDKSEYNVFKEKFIKRRTFDQMPRDIVVKTPLVQVNLSNQPFDEYEIKIYFKNAIRDHVYAWFLEVV